MEWSIRKGVDGVITDDPKLFREVCERWERGEGTRGRSWRQLGREVVMRIVMAMLMPAVWMQTRPNKVVRMAVGKVMR
jgi:phosphatidylglycerol phospholipase C